MIAKNSNESAYFFNVEKCKNLLSSIQNLNNVETLEQEIKSLSDFLEEYKTLKREIDDTESLKYEPSDGYADENIFLNSKSKSKAIEIAKLQDEINEFKKQTIQYEEIKHNESQMKQNIKDKMFYKTKIESAINEVKTLDRLDGNFKWIINNIINSAKRDENSEIDNIIMKKYCTLQVLSSVKITEMNDETSYKVAFRNLPDECLDFKKNQYLSQLTPKMIESYKSIFEKRNIKTNPREENTKPNYLHVDNLNDYKIISKNYINLLCFVLTKQEIEQATKKFTIDWVNGSNVLTYNIGAQASKQATIVLPLYYPLCGTSNIKLTSLCGYEGSNDNSYLKNFTIKNNLSSLTEWITVFTEMFYTKKIF